MDLTPEARTLAVIVVGVIALWVTEALPLAVTALLGAVACVVGGVAPATEVFRPFADPLIFLFIGAFILAEAIRVHGLDRRLAYTVLAVPWVDGRPRRILVAVAAVCTVASAFLSNTCTAAMMLAIVVGILTAIDEAATAAGPDAPRPAAGFATGLLLCVAFASSIGGLATPIGTPPNLIGLGFIRNQLGVNVTFLGWCAVGVPLVLAMTAVILAILTTLFPAGVTRVPGVVEHVAAERCRLGAWTVGQRSTAVAFALTVTLWVAPGILLVALGPSHPLCLWLRERLPEGVAALIGAVLLFILPGDRPVGGGPRPRALAWPQARIDWGIVLLYGGGMALGQLCFTTGLAESLGRSITGWIPAGPWQATLLVAVAAAVAAFTSEFTSNTASATMVVPVVIALGQAAAGDPLPAALAATFASSLGFMMPVSTPCNAIVYGAGRVPLRSMMHAGILLDLAGTVLVTALLLATAGWFGG